MKYNFFSIEFKRFQKLILVRFPSLMLKFVPIFTSFFKIKVTICLWIESLQSTKFLVQLDNYFIIEPTKLKHKQTGGGRNVKFHYYDWQFFSERRK